MSKFFEKNWVFFVIGLGVLFTGNAFAQADTTVELKWGELVASLVLSAGSVAVGVIAFAKKYLPAPARWAAEALQLDQVIKRSIEAAAFDFADKLKDQQVTLSIKNDLLRETVKNVIANASEMAKRHQATLEIKVKARIEEYLDNKYGKK